MALDLAKPILHRGVAVRPWRNPTLTSSRYPLGGFKVHEVPLMPGTAPEVFIAIKTQSAGTSHSCLTLI